MKTWKLRKESENYCGICGARRVTPKVCLVVTKRGEKKKNKKHRSDVVPPGAQS